MTPVHSTTQRLLTQGCSTAAAREQQKDVVHPPRDLLHGERAHAGGGELNRERDAVQAVADLSHKWRVLRRQSKRGQC